MTRPAGLTSLVRELAGLGARVDERHAENQRQFAALVAGQADANAKLDSLLESRTFVRGIWKAVLFVSSAVSTAIGLTIAYFTTKS